MKFQKSNAGKSDVDPTYGFTAPLEVDLGVTIGTLQTSYCTYILRAKTKGKICAHALPHALSLRIPPLHLGGLWRYYASCNFGPCLSI
jgi:hypothetical protein